MPELAEVQTIIRGLEPRLRGRRITRARLRHRSLYRRGSLTVRYLVDRTFAGVERVGKNAVFRFRPEGLMVVNLGMTGRLLLSGMGDDRPRGNRSHLHGRFHLDDRAELRYYDTRRFGFIFVAERCDIRDEFRIGPDPFDADGEYFRRALENRRAPIKALLLDQRLISGLGNIYADEALFEAGVDPHTPGDSARHRAGEILSAVRSVLQRAIDHGGSTVRDYRKHDGSSGGFQRFHAVYGREGERCHRCGAAIEKTVIAGRGTHFCPICQKV